VSQQVEHRELRIIPPSSPSAFWVVILLFMAGGAALLLSVDKGALHIMFNRLWTPTLDTLVPFLTMLGDGLAATVLSIALLTLHSPRAGFQAGFGSLLSGAVTQFLKHVVFPEAVRPLQFFRDSYALHLVPGVEIYSYNSFPSGHAATAVAVCFGLAMLVTRSWVRILLAVLALAVALSRVYLSQHFFGDVYAGVVIGAGVAWLTAVLLQRWREHGAEWLDRPLLRFGRGSGV